MTHRPLRILLAAAGYVVVALAFSWPLPLHLSTHLTGSPDGDTGVYVWNQWVFHHELVDRRNLPYFTDRIFSLGRPANLSLHNYTTFQNLVALPLIDALGVVATFNVVYLAMTVLTAFMAYLLAREVTNSDVESWLAGLAFAWCPMLVTRGMGHFSVAAAAPLAAFTLVLVRAAARERTRDAVLLGAAMWWAASTDAYFAVYCLLIAAVFLGTRLVVVERAASRRGRAVRWTLDVLLLCIAGLVAAIVVSGGWQFQFLGRMARMRSLYTPVLVLTVLALARLAWQYRTHLVTIDRPHAWRVLRLGTVAVLLAAALLSPVLYAVSERMAAGDFGSSRTFWRSSPHGADLLALVLPNPNHPLSPAMFGAWVSSLPSGYLENVASLPLTLVAVVAIACRLGWRIPRMWGLFVVLFGLLALGPFVHIATINTYIPGPWALLRYVPIIGLARTPARFTAVVMLALVVLFAAALVWLTARFPQRRRTILAVVALVLFAELLPVPRPLYSAEIPRLYRHVAAAPPDSRLLELPFGIRDGTSSIGNFTARSQFFQTYHRHPIIGGYLSRISRQRITEIRRYAVLDGMITLSEGKPLDPARRAQLVAAGPTFIARSRLRYVVVERAATSAELRQFAIDALDLRFVESDGPFDLYRVGGLPDEVH